MMKTHDKGDAMILVNIDSLSMSELRNIAQQEGILNIDKMDREEIISELRDKYADDDDEQNEIGSDSNMRYLSGITDYREIDEYVPELPGVEELPEVYPDTEIHLMLRSSSWAYCYWQLSQLESDRIADAGGSLFLAVRIVRSGAEEYYDIPVSLSDNEWNIGIPYGDGSASVSLISEVDCERKILASSGTIALIESYWLEHRCEMKESDSLYRLYLSLITTREGQLVENPVVQDIVESFREEDADL